MREEGIPRFDQQKNIAHIRLEGPLSEQRLLAAVTAAANAREYQPGMGRLWDCRRADLSALDAATLERLARITTKLPPGVRDVKVAIVTARPPDFGSAAMYEALSAGTATTITRVFDNVEDAEAWLTDSVAG